MDSFGFKPLPDFLTPAITAPEQTEERFLDALPGRLEAIAEHKVSPAEDNLLKISAEAEKLRIDPSIMRKAAEMVDDPRAEQMAETYAKRFETGNPPEPQQKPKPKKPKLGSDLSALRDFAGSICSLISETDISGRGCQFAFCLPTHLDKLQCLGVVGRRGEKISAAGINYILRNETYVGDKRLLKKGRKELFTGAESDNESVYLENDHEAVVDRETWNAVQKRLDAKGMFGRQNVQRGGGKTHFFTTSSSVDAAVDS